MKFTHIYILFYLCHQEPIEAHQGRLEVKSKQQFKKATNPGSWGDYLQMYVYRTWRVTGNITLVGLMNDNNTYLNLESIFFVCVYDISLLISFKASRAFDLSMNKMITLLLENLNNLKRFPRKSHIAYILYTIKKICLGSNNSATICYIYKLLSIIMSTCQGGMHNDLISRHIRYDKLIY